MTRPGQKNGQFFEPLQSGKRPFAEPIVFSVSIAQKAGENPTDNSVQEIKSGYQSPGPAAQNNLGQVRLAKKRTCVLIYGGTLRTAIASACPL